MNSTKRERERNERLRLHSDARFDYVEHTTHWRPSCFSFCWSFGLAWQPLSTTSHCHDVFFLCLFLHSSYFFFFFYVTKILYIFYFYVSSIHSFCSYTSLAFLYVSAETSHGTRTSFGTSLFLVSSFENISGREPSYFSVNVRGES